MSLERLAKMIGSSKSYIWELELAALRVDSAGLFGRWAFNAVATEAEIARVHRVGICRGDVL